MSIGWAVSIGGGRQLRAQKVPGRDRPVLGIVKGGTFLVLAEFIADDDMDAMKTALDGVVMIPTRVRAQ